MTEPRPRAPELMSPAGHWPQLHAAIEAGADAVYFGLKHFSARAKVGFGLDELREVMRTLHRRGVKGFVTFNTLVFDHEWKLAEEGIREIAAAGCDAVIVQDVGIAQLARRIAPGLAIHGSTQMSVTSAQGVELAASFGCSRVVLGRELSLADIRRIRQKTDVELEVFVHGALCVSYSGQCFSSEAWGGRSANRGQCAQACRLSYDLIVDGEFRDLGPSRYLLSPGDLYAVEQIPELVELGIACVKIEGRYKDANYVALTTSAYREAIDRALQWSPPASSESLDAKSKRLELEQIYSRGLGPHFLSGTNHQAVVQARAPRHRGLRVGTVVEVGKSHVVVDPLHEIHPGDGLVFDAANWRSPDEPEEGGNAYHVTPVATGKQMRLEFRFGQIDFGRIREGDWVWRTSDPQLVRRLKSLTSANDPVHTRPIQFWVSARSGQPIDVLASLETGESARYVGEVSLEPASSREIEREQLAQQLGRLGGTPFHLGELQLEAEGNPFVPVSLLNQARRFLVEQLLAARVKVPAASISDQLPAETDPLPEVKQEEALETEVQLHLLVRTPEQLQAALNLNPASITLDYLELYGLRPSVEQIQGAGIPARVASPRILKPSEQNIVRFLLSLECQILVRSGGLLYDLVRDEAPNHSADLFGDFSLNVANQATARAFLQMGLKRLTPTHDLNAEQIADLAAAIPAGRLEVIAYQHLPVFHMEHCVFCRFLSDGTDHTNCGHPCEQHRVAVRDGQGRAHPVMADVGCRNTVFGAEPQSAAPFLDRFQAAGIRHFRLEFVHQSGDQVTAVVQAFQDYLSSSRSTSELVQQLDRCSSQPTTEGSLFVPPRFKDLVQLN